MLFTNPVTSRQREVRIDGKFVDLLFEVDGIFHIVELKRDTITREAVGQVLEYYGRLRLANPKRKYQVVLAAPSIPAYRKLILEDFGIRCAEIQFPTESETADDGSAVPDTDILCVRSALKRSSPLADVENMVLEQVHLEDLQPPCTKSSISIARKLLLDAIPKVQATFSGYEVKPVAMGSSQHNVICLPSGITSVPCAFMQDSAWWAFAFGKSEQLAKNDTPNISAIAYPWGLDFDINAELLTSQRAMLATIRRDSKKFDMLVGEHGRLAFQTWLKLEHQPRIYHWIPMIFKRIGEWNARDLLATYEDLQYRYTTIRQEWLTTICTHQERLSGSQAAHMQKNNTQMNLAIRLVRTFEATDPVWTQPYSDQRLVFEHEYVRLKPLIEFFN
jgi:hypothetical protein